ncbi:hypothetical protein SERLA73DRAFT_136388 [Serpula lacrymans var. lacrymans S7.3]|uniref:CCHC-type domain-containing protein n=2 Tax=Serpula lacrymans var. lacrymans TaxID=341189 RepID=F8PUS8_SERL3|nr:uncharacterized protein SERLADRAFT_466996 [Serpula lacrymans var. lacrymans S7.9]EGO00486.1 hypothetical protein SERLA73DRAFT_136388 [Serpula lacrymans var. lacrymans S7.3]EGO26036.1 hypothetical protein SERLADRAFT_466996 [Serpula lacrymans var. lacrymans S7.9]
MTRVTNFGRKRTYVEAGFNGGGPEAAASDTDKTSADIVAVHESTNIDGSPAAEGPASPPNKKRKRSKQSKKNGDNLKSKSDDSKKSLAQADDREDSGQPDAREEILATTSAEGNKLQKRAEQKHSKKKRDAARGSESRRQKRISERQADTICFACRKKGHAARDCPTATEGRKNNKIVGICYRCGSSRHNLARCKKPEDPLNPLPFASCFVCSGKGHLASSCPKNKERGIYPDGGCCKLCGDTTHLAKNCGLRKEGTSNNNAAFLGIGHDAGADEDDFHMFKRRAGETDAEEMSKEGVKRRANIRMGQRSGVVKAFGEKPLTTSKKVVFF